MTDKIDPVTIEEWHKKARELFGDQARHWKFVCPICNTVQSGQDFVDAGVSQDTAESSIAVECIGRFLPEKQKAFEGKVIKGKPCNYAGYGLFKLNPVPVLFEDGKIFNAFAFAEN